MRPSSRQSISLASEVTKIGVIESYLEFSPEQLENEGKTTVFYSNEFFCRLSELDVIRRQIEWNVIAKFYLPLFC